MLLNYSGRKKELSENQCKIKIFNDIQKLHLMGERKNENNKSGYKLSKTLKHPIRKIKIDYLFK